ncbi:glycosyltransferase [Sporosarcina koreensis]|uniref:Glycosyltransferase n=1 Tax=Sporosarcina koreensis TaxID=334735 RepID=A0ABW0U0G8_9BACL
MRTLIAVETVFFKTPDQEIWTTGQNDYTFWKRYLHFFDEILVVSRVKTVEEKDDNWIKASGPNVTFVELPFYQGPRQYLQKDKIIKDIIKENIVKADAYILRVPGRIASLCWFEIRRRKLPYFLEVCGDPWESLRRGNVKSIVRPIARVLSYWRLKSQCINAEATSYVTNYALQKRYPPNPLKPTFSISDVVLNESVAINYIDRKYKYSKERVVKIINAGTMNTFYKGHETQLEALKHLIKKGYNVKLFFAGDGKLRGHFERKVKKMSLEKNVVFLGMISGSDQLQREFNKYDLFILPSYVEGMPRVLIEAMAVSLPCIASDVGGIPEILNAKCLVKPRNPVMLADKIIEIITDDEKMENYSKENFLKSTEYSKSTLDAKRTSFYSLVKKQIKLYILQ